MGAWAEWLEEQFLGLANRFPAGDMSTLLWRHMQELKKVTKLEWGSSGKLKRSLRRLLQGSGEGAPAEEIVADLGLYSAKRGGRNAYGTPASPAATGRSAKQD